MSAPARTDWHQPDVETASDGYAARFSGPTGAWMLAVQERAFRALLPAPAGSGVLDVGGGHAQLAVPLARAGRSVTVVGSAPAAARRLGPAIADGSVRFVAADLLALPFPARAFDAVVSARLLPHAERWRELVAELCRVARGTVIVDYPTLASVNRVAPALFGAKKGIEGNTRPFTLFEHREVAEAFAAAGFRPAGRVAQFFFPMVLHRALRCRPCSAALEGAAAALGLTRRFGSPVVARFDRAG